MARHQEIETDQIIKAARRIFLKHGATVSVMEIADDLKISHTTIFNRFKSKEALMIASLGPPHTIQWVENLQGGPDSRPFKNQLIELGKAMSSYLGDLQEGVSVLQAAGISPKKVYATHKGKEPPPLQAFHAIVAWLRRAQLNKQLGPCNTDILATPLIGALFGRTFTRSVCGVMMTRDDDEAYVESMVELLLCGVCKSQGRASRSRQTKDR